MRVLLVEDNDELRGFLELSLKESDVDTVVAESIEDALRQIDGEKFDACVIDSVLENSDGIALTQQIRATKNGRGTPIVVMSNVSTALARRMAKNAGCNEFLPKPFGIGQLLELLKNLG